MKISRKIEIDYGHCLPEHYSFCKEIHGHRGVITCIFSGDINNESGSDNGMIIDFAICKQIMMEQIH